MRRGLVTGGSGDIGSAICRRLAADGLHVVVHANRNAERAERVVETIRADGGSAEACIFDVTERTLTANAIGKLLEKGSVQVLVNNAGIRDDVPFPGMSPEQWHSVINVTLNGFYNVTRPLIMPMIKTRWGRIVNMSSISGITGNRGQSNYAAAKAALHGASKSLAVEVASRGITVNVVAPGIIEGKMTKEIFDQEDIAQWVPMKRAGRPEEVADLVAFLASDRATYLSGQIIALNGAMLMG